MPTCLLLQGRKKQSHPPLRRKKGQAGSSADRTKPQPLWCVYRRCVTARTEGSDERKGEIASCCISLPGVQELSIFKVSETNFIFCISHYLSSVQAHIYTQNLTCQKISKDCPEGMSFSILFPSIPCSLPHSCQRLQKNPRTIKEFEFQTSSKNKIKSNLGGFYTWILCVHDRTPLKDKRAYVKNWDGN